MKKNPFKALVLGPVRHRRTVRILILLLLFAALLAVLRGHYHNDLARMLPDGSESARTYDRIVKSGMFNKVVLIFHPERGSFADSPLPEYLDRLAPKLEANPMIQKVNYRLFEGELGKQADGLTAFLPQAMPPPDLSKKEAERLVGNLYRELLKPSGIGRNVLFQHDPLGMTLPFYRKLAEFQKISGIGLLPGSPYLVSENGRYALMLLDTAVPVADPGKSRTLIEFLEKSLSDLPSGTVCDPIIPHRRAVANETVLKNDVQTMGWISLLIFPLLFLIFYRKDYRSFLIPLLPLPASLLVLGLMTGIVFREGVLLFVIGMGGIVVSLAVDYGIHIYAAMNGPSRYRTLIRLAPALFAGMLTSVLVFGLFLFSPMEGCRQLGFFAGGSLLLSLILMLLLMPALLSGRRKRPGSGEEETFRLVQIVKRIAEEHPKRTASIGIGIFVLCMIPLPYLTFQSDMRYFDVTPEKDMHAEEIYAREFQKGESPAFLLFDGKDPDSAMVRAADALAVMRGKTGQLFFSPTDLIGTAVSRAENRKLWSEALRSGKLDRWEQEIRKAGEKYGFRPEAFDSFFRNLREGILRPPDRIPLFFEPILKRMVQVGEADTTIAVLTPDRDAESLRELSGGVLVSRNSLGARIAADVSGGMAGLGTAALISVLLFTGLYFRSWKRGLLALLPVFASLSVAGSLFALTGYPVNISVLIAGIILCGLSVDYGIFLVHEHGLSPRVFHAVTLSAVTSAAGGLTVVFTRHPMLRDAGLTLLAGILTAWACAVFLIPAFLQLGSEKKKKNTLPAILLCAALTLPVLSGCRTPDVFPEPVYEPVPPEAVPEKPRPIEYLAENSVEFHFLLRSAVFLSPVRIDEKTGTIACAGLSPAGALLFSMSGKAGIPDTYWFMPGFPWINYQRQTAEHILRALERIYLNNHPPEHAEQIRRDGRLIYRTALDGGGILEYVYAGNPPELIRKSRGNFFGDDWRVFYYGTKNGRPGNLVYEDKRNRIRMILRIKKGARAE